MRIEQCLARLWPQLDDAAIAVTGGVAIGLVLGVARPVADVDLVTPRMESVRSAEGFLVSHRHAGGILQLVDPATRLRVDIFPGTIAGARRMRLGALTPLVLDAPALLAHKLRLLAGDGEVDPKHWRDAVALAAWCGAPEPARPRRMAETVYATDVDARCARCEEGAHPAFPRAAKREILAVLGYV